MVKDDTILVLGGLGLAGYLLFKSNIAKNLGEVGSGVGEAVGGLGSGISTIGREAGDIVVDVGSVLEPLAASFQGSANFISDFFQQQQSKLRRESEQSDVVDRGAFDISRAPITELQAAKDVNKAASSTERSFLIQDQLTDLTRGFTNFDEFVISGLRNAGGKIKSSVTGLVSAASSTIGNFSAELASRINRDSVVSLSATPETGGSVVLPSSSRTSSVRSSGGGSSSSSSSSSSRNFSPAPVNMSVAPSNKTSSVRSTGNGSSFVSSAVSKVKSAVSSATSKAKSLISSITKKLRR